MHKIRHIRTKFQKRKANSWSKNTMLLNEANETLVLHRPKDKWKINMTQQIERDQNETQRFDQE